MKIYSPGTIVHVDNQEVNKYEQGRPFVIVGYSHPAYMIAPLTTREHAYDDDVTIGTDDASGLLMQSHAKCQSFTTVGQKSVRKALGHISEEKTSEIVEKIRAVTNRMLEESR